MTDFRILNLNNVKFCGQNIFVKKNKKNQTIEQNSRGPINRTYWKLNN